MRTPHPLRVFVSRIHCGVEWRVGAHVGGRPWLLLRNMRIMTPSPGNVLGTTGRADNLYRTLRSALRTVHKTALSGIARQGKTGSSMADQAMVD